MFTVKIIMHQCANWKILDLVSQKFYSCNSFEFDNESKSLTCKKNDDVVVISLINPDFTDDGFGNVKSVYVENESGKTVYAFHGSDFLSQHKAHIEAVKNLDEILESE